MNSIMGDCCNQPAGERNASSNDGNSNNDGDSLNDGYDSANIILDSENLPVWSASKNGTSI